MVVFEGVGVRLPPLDTFGPLLFAELLKGVDVRFLRGRIGVEAMFFLDLIGVVSLVTFLGRFAGVELSTISPGGVLNKSYGSKWSILVLTQVADFLLYLDLIQSVRV